MLRPWDAKWPSEAETTRQFCFRLSKPAGKDGSPDPDRWRDQRCPESRLRPAQECKRHFPRYQRSRNRWQTPFQRHGLFRFSAFARVVPVAFPALQPPKRVKILSRCRDVHLRQPKRGECSNSQDRADKLNLSSYEHSIFGQFSSKLDRDDSLESRRGRGPVTALP